MGSEIRDIHSEEGAKALHTSSESAEKERAAAGLGLPPYPSAGVEDEQVFHFEESRKLGIMSSVFLILNKMIGTGSRFLRIVLCGCDSLTSVSFLNTFWNLCSNWECRR